LVFSHPLSVFHGDATKCRSDEVRFFVDHLVLDDRVAPLGHMLDREFKNFVDRPVDVDTELGSHAIPF